MDFTTQALINAIELLLADGHKPAPGKHPDRWMFQEGSEIHIALTEALNQARLSTGFEGLDIEIYQQV